MSEPRRRYVLTLEIQCDQLSDIELGLREVRQDIIAGTTQSVGGGFASRHQWKLDYDPTWNHDRYMTAIGADD